MDLGFWQAIRVGAALMAAIGLVLAYGRAEAGAPDVAGALRPARGEPRVVAVLAHSEGTETTDFLLPYALLRRAGGVELVAVADRIGAVPLMPALSIQIDQDLAAFDRAYPQGADVVIVPALHREDDPQLLAWLQRQAQQGALLLAVCSGARVLGQAGLLDGRRFAGHWFDRSTLLRRHPGSIHVPDQRYVLDRSVLSSTGVSASLPVSLALIEALLGSARAKAVADELGVNDWGPTHESAPFGLMQSPLLSVALNSVAFWRQEHLLLDVPVGTDDVGLALLADAWARSGRAALRVRGEQPIRLRSGLMLRPDVAPAARQDLTLQPDWRLPAARQLDDSLCVIEQRFGDSTRRWVAMLLEYRPGLARQAPCQARQALIER